MIDPTIGPKRSPLGFAGDPGGLPLYKNGTLVGGVGVISDGVYGLVRHKDATAAVDEAIALAATTGFGAPEQIRGNRIVVDGRTLTFTNSRRIGQWRRSPMPARSTWRLPAVFRRYGLLRWRRAAGRPAPSGFGNRAFCPTRTICSRAIKAYILADATGVNRFPPRDGNGITAAEVTQILRSALGVALQARAQIRQPLGSFVEVTISVVDVDGNILGIVRTPDAPVFGTDVSLQKARSTLFFSSAAAFSVLPTSAQAMRRASFLAPTFRRRRRFWDNALGGWRAFAARSIGNLARPFYPDGVNGRRNGPLSLPFANWSPFNTGLQLDLVSMGSSSMSFLLPIPTVTPSTSERAVSRRLGNGLQIFAGGVPIFRGQTCRRRHRRVRRRHRPGRHGGVPRPRSGRPGARHRDRQAPKQRRADRLEPRQRQSALGPVSVHPVQRLERPERLQGEMTVRSPSPSPCPAPGPRRGHGGGRRGCPDDRARDRSSRWRRSSDGPGRRSRCPPPPEPPADPSAVTVAAARPPSRATSSRCPTAGG